MNRILGNRVRLDADMLQGRQVEFSEPISLSQLISRGDLPLCSEELPSDPSVCQEVRTFDSAPQLFRVCVIGPEKTPSTELTALFWAAQSAVLLSAH